MTRAISIRRAGFTLIEITLSLTILAILMLGAQAAVIVAAKGIPDGRTGAARLNAAANVLDLLAAELNYAVAINAMSAHAVEFVVQDRDGDGQADTIRYEWTGTAGGPLTRRFNGNSPITVADRVQQFQLTYDKRATPSATTYTESAETTLASFDGLLSLGSATVDSSNWRGQYFTPTLPPDAVSWRVTRASIRARVNGAAQGETKVQIRPAIGGVPSNIVIDETSLFENTLTSAYQWREIQFSNAGNLGPSAAMCLVLQWVSDSDSCQIQFRNNLLGAPASYMVTGKASGWNTSNDSMLFYIMGTYTTANPTTYTYNLTAVRCAFRTSGDSSGTLNTTIRIFNEPTVAGP